MNYQAYEGTTGAPDGLKELHLAAAYLQPQVSESDSTDQPLNDFQRAQYKLWSGLRARGNPWLITDFISAGTPMYFADVLYTRRRKTFDDRVRRRELPTCPPQNEEQDHAEETEPAYSYCCRGRDVLYDGAPFAVVRWTNLWFPHRPQRFGVLGDWFGGPLQPLFGPGIRDVPVSGNGWKRFIPGYIHALYFKFPEDQSPDSVRQRLRQALALEEVGLSPTDDQVSSALCLLAQAGFNAEAVDAAYAELIDPRRSVPDGSVQEWLESLTRSRVACLIDDLRRRQSRGGDGGAHLVEHTERDRATWPSGGVLPSATPAGRPAAGP
ncbi:hypothetical protein [Streptomyces agglomeratus]|uniref:hypothetical protein n=1 Tax=Streptomyces agglomeratus TaxID=285458 RepID=UPI00114D0998|nr:hypothetical protein [Streptomyces agglomeratus]